MSGIDALERITRTAARSPLLEGWRIVHNQDAFWTEYEAPSGLRPEVGIKLHVSSSVGCAPEVLTRCLAVLAEHGITFKHVASLPQLSYLSTGRGGPTQVGKFLTAYPPDDATAEQVARLLHEATAGLSGPRIPNEEAFAASSLVYSRYGSFNRRWIQLPTGRIAAARKTANGWEVDDRNATSTGELAGRQRVLRETYVRTHRVYSSPKGCTHLGFVDSAEGGALVVIKEAYAHTMEDLAGRDARSRLSDEAACLRAVGTTGIAPQFLDYWEEAGSSFLVYVPIPGSPLAALLSELSGQGLRLPFDLLQSWTASLCAAVTRLHAAGYVSCDIKPSNIVVTEEGLCLIDLELAGPPTDEPTGGMGTPGYCSPQQADPAGGRSTLDDVYAIGATLLAMATLTDASVLPDLVAVAALEAARDPSSPVYGVAARCLAEDETSRFPTPQAVAAALTQPPMPVAGPIFTADDPMGLATEIGERLLETAVGTDRRYTHWRSAHSTTAGQPCRDLYSGSTGPALFLCALTAATGRTEYLETAIRCGTWLWETEPAVPRLAPMPGLYFGESGPALLYVRLYRDTGDATWLKRAQAVSSGLDAAAIRSPDLMTGVAGAGLLHLALWHTTHDEQALDRASDCARELLRRRDPERPVWRIPAGFDRLSGREYAGFSHGSAGVGYLLAECFLVTGTEEIGSACADVADWVIGLAEPALGDQSGLCWNAIDGSGTAYGTTWCHGTAGISRFLLRSHAATGDSAHLEAALRAGRTTAKGPPWTGTSQCHGLAGSLEILVDLAQQTGDPSHLSAAKGLADHLTVYRSDDGWPSDERSLRCPDLMVGEAGVGAALLRLADPSSPHLVSCAAFR